MIFSLQIDNIEVGEVRVCKEWSMPWLELNKLEEVIKCH
jgi:hypothetical protein